MGDAVMPMVTLDEVLDVVETGSRPNGGTNSDTIGVPSLGGENLKQDGTLDLRAVRRVSHKHFDSMRTGHLELGDVLINKDGAQTGKVARYFSKFQQAAINEHLFLLRGNDKIRQDFLFQVLFSLDTQRTIQRLITGSAQPGLNRSFLKTARIPVPPLEEQRRIAEILDTLDETIQATERVIVKHEAIRSGLASDLLTGKASGSATNNTSRGWGMGDWRQSSLSDVAEILDHRRVPVRVDDRPRGSVPYFGANGQQGWIDRPLFDEPLILLAEDGGHFDEFARRPIAYRINGPSWVNNHAHVLRAATRVDQSFLFWSLRNKDIRRWIAGGTRSKLTRGEMEQIEIRVPPVEEQRRIAEILDEADETIQANEEQLKKLQRLRSGLADDLLSGRVRTVER